jgi:hypothetical protein
LHAWDRVQLEVILWQMKHCHERSLQLNEELQAQVDAGVVDEASAKRIEQTTNSMLRLFEMARVRAVDAAPYCHARLASVALETSPAADPEKAAEANSSYGELYGSALAPNKGVLHQAHPHSQNGGCQSVYSHDDDHH